MKYPIGLSIILNALAAISILSGCSDYLDREYDSFIDNEMTFTSYERTSKFLVNAYRYLPDGFNRIGSEATFAGTQVETDTERDFFRFLVRAGIPVRVESNR